MHSISQVKTRFLSRRQPACAEPKHSSASQLAELQQTVLAQKLFAGEGVRLRVAGGWGAVRGAAGPGRAPGGVGDEALPAIAPRLPASWVSWMLLSQKPAFMVLLCLCTARPGSGEEASCFSWVLP